jgi:hypothetical protein
LKRILTIVFILFASIHLSAQKTMEAFRTTEKITIDGKATESDWSKAQMIGQFTQFKPQPGTPSTQKTEVKIMYDDDALYIFAICYDKPEHVSEVLSQRDDFNANVDNFQILLDTYNDKQNGFDFGVSSMGVQYDSKLYFAGENIELNMVWESAVERNEIGWQCEMRIPYSAFRFPKVDVQNWGVNFFRYISHNREESTWPEINPEIDNWLLQNASLTNVQGIQPPLRLAFMPYVSAYADHFPLNQVGASNWSRSFNGGMDIKLGLNEAFTLDMTLVPDFGQVVFDNKVLNLSPFEIQFNENRQFFTEGTELFSKSGLFYSRRIGIQSPYSVLSTNLLENENLTNVPSSSQLYNATKVSGRTKTGLGIGVFNAITAEQTATAYNSITGAERTIVAAPLTNYNVLVADQNLKNNSSITLTNTNVTRVGNFYDANVTGLNIKLNTKNNKYFISGKTNLSNKFYADKTKTGYNYGLNFGKQTGNFIITSAYFEESNTYDPNDLGFNAVNNKRVIETTASYRIFKPFWKLNQMGITSTLSYNRLYQPNAYTNTYLNLNGYFITKKFHAFGFNANSSITHGFDYFEPRKDGRYFVTPKWLDFGGWISTNYQKRVALDVNVNYVVLDRDTWEEYYYSISPRFRLSDKIILIYSWEQYFQNNGQGYAIAFGEPVEVTNEIVFGSRDLVNTTNTIDLKYTLTNRMGISFRLRHYRSSLSYDSFFDLQNDGSLLANNLTGLDADGVSVYNTNFNAFTIDFVYRWVFRPGSEISFVWKNAIFSDDKFVQTSYLQNVQNMFEYSPLNSLSIKVLYWLDYQSLKKLGTKKKEKGTMNNEQGTMTKS